ncbi:hypothetical protein [Vibrio agarivorans]|uniref:Glycosyltransferase family 1 protein n=1 Tax=Vibrio agarivorans TaxID=153622 RepID=A0ABT7XW41_9VIBR|nr:hypothetical protein [Vibrio agarivorans]MDN2479996.1 hypothetical protein [Vibrio agarivorans]
MRILFVTSELTCSNTSAAIRNRNFVRGLLSIGTVDLYEIKQYSNAQVLYSLPKEIKSYFQMRLDYSTESNAHVSHSMSSKIRGFFTKVIKSVIPDKLAILEISGFPELYLGNYDVIISSSDPKGIHIATSRFISKYKKDFKGKYIQYWGDPWYDDISRSTNLLTRISEKKLLGFSDCVIYNSKRTLERQKTIYPHLSDKMNYLPRGIFSEVGDYTVDIPPVSRDCNEIVYAGDYRSRYRNITPLLEAIESSEFVLNVYGDGDLPDKSYEKTTFSSRLPKEELDKITRSASVQIVLMNDKGGQIPGKLFDLMLSSHHVLVILDGEFTIDDIPCSERFFICENSKESILHELMKIRSGSGTMTLDLKNYGINELVSNMFTSLIEDK